jgi:hypothetical protein
MVSIPLLVTLITVACVWTGLVAALMVRAARGRHVARTMRKIAYFHLGMLLVAGLLLIDLRPTVTTPLMSTADKILLRDASNTSADRLRYELNLSDDLIERGLRSAADLAHLELHSQIRATEDNRRDVQLSLGLPVGYINASLSGTAQVTDGALQLQLDRLWIGRIYFPGPLRAAVGWCAVQILQTTPITAQAIAAVSSAEIREGGARLEIAKDQNLASEMLTYFQSADSQENIDRALQVVRRWLAEGQQWTQGLSRDETFVLTTQRLFDWSQQAAPEWSAVRQNQVALLACGIALGHPRIVEISGQRLQMQEVRQIDRRRSATVTAHGRQDLVQHFWISAALVQLASAKLSDLAGISKEEMDSGPGGSGFSFADLMADRAGVRFAQRATESEQAAMELQFQLRLTWQVSDLIPPIDQIPEGISERDFAEIYGGINGQLTSQWSKEINHRLDQAKLLKP